MSSRAMSFIETGIRFWRRSDTTRRWRIVLGAIVGGIVLCLLVAPKPWVAAAQIRGKVDTLDYVRIYGWIAGAINMALLGGLAAICPWWTRGPQLSTLNSRLSSRKPLAGSGHW